ncbi:MAG: hypothetical protein HRT58_00090 [Crocinitomicaceae bacterium]|nr:hypothetical protein [Flavobacteriales bacterium]NQZ34019.1 hypothetical protein [Crocinitomicaceae bacterium]
MLKLISQVEISSGNLVFNCPSPLEPYDYSDLGIDLFGFENDDYAVEIESLPYLQAEDVDKYVLDVSKRFNYTVLSYNIDHCPAIRRSAYILSWDILENEKTPVYILVIMDESEKLLYEITVHCYNLNQREGKEIVDSFKLRN